MLVFERRTSIQSNKYNAFFKSFFLYYYPGTRHHIAHICTQIPYYTNFTIGETFPVYLSIYSRATIFLLLENRAGKTAAYLNYYWRSRAARRAAGCVAFARTPGAAPRASPPS